MFSNLIEALAVLLALIGAALWLRNRGVLKQEHSPTLARMITDLMLPALIFSSLSRHPLELDRMPPALIMLVTTLTMLALAWWIGRRIGLGPAQLGAFVLVAGVGSSSTIGYTLVGQVFRGDPEAAFDAVMIGEIGAILPLFLVGVPIGIHFGTQASGGEAAKGEHWREVRAFARSPIFLAMVAGFAASFLPQPEWTVIGVFYRVLEILGNALPVYVALTIGLLLRPVSWRTAAIPIAAVLLLKLMIEPVLAAQLATIGHVPRLERNVLVIEAAMPSGTIATIVAARYGCDGGFASTVVVISYVASLLSIPLLVMLTT